MTRIFRIATGRGYRLWASYVSRAATPDKPLVILCHGLGVASNYHLIATLKASLVKQKFPVLIFDFAGHGKSGGTIKDRLVKIFKADLGDCVRYVQKAGLATHGIVIIGHSIGALTALLYAGSHPKDIVGVVPIACNAEAKRKEMKLMADGKIRDLKRYSMIGKSKIPKQFWKDRSRFEPKSFAQRLRLPVVFIVGSRDTINPPEESRLLYRWTPSAQKKVVLVPGADHSFKPLAHQERVAATIRTWLQKM